MATFEIEVFAFQPFSSRVGQDTVLGLRCPYDAALVKGLKAVLQPFHAPLRATAPRMQTAGGWLDAPRCWFVERPAWPAVAALLLALGYCVPGVPEEAASDPPREAPP